MKHKFIKKINKVLLVQTALLLYFALCANVFAVEQPRLTVQQNQIEAKRGQAKQQIHRLRLLEKIETNRLYKNQQKLEHTQTNLQKNKRQYTNAKNEVESLEKRLEVLLVEHRKYQTYASKRIIQIFKHKRDNYIEFLFNSGDINAFLDRLYFENIVIAHDKKKLRETKACAREVLAVKARIEMHKRDLESSIATINRQQTEIQNAISKNEKLIEKLKTDRATWEKAEKDLARQSRVISNMINSELRKTSKDGSVRVSVTGGFIRPVPGKITSPYGTRVHPIFKRKIYHSGVDIGAPYGTSIRAANSGRVMFVGWYSGYGKTIIINHGNINGIPTVTLYAHMSQTLVRQGANVAKGAVIGRVGTTGYATGPHLHFEVRQKGNPVNPLNFVR